MSNRAAIRYAKAVLELASENNRLDSVRTDMQTLSDSLRGSDELQATLANPVLSTRNKKEVLTKIFSDTTPLTQNLIGLLAANKRIGLLQAVADNFLQMYNRQSGEVEAVVTTATPLDAALEQKVLQKVKELTKADKVSLKNVVDSAVLGGFVLRVGDTQYDASVAHSFAQLEKAFQA